MNAADMVGVPEFMPEYKGEKRFLKDGQVIDLGGRQLVRLGQPAVVHHAQD